MCLKFCILFMLYILNGVASTVPLCCPKGQKIANISRDVEGDRFNCTELLSKSVLTLIDRIPTRLLNYRCPHITLQDVIHYEPSLNVTLTSAIEALSVTLNETNNCFDIPNEGLSLTVYSCDGKQHPSDPKFEALTSSRPPYFSWAVTICSSLSSILLIVSAVIFRTDASLKKHPHSRFVASHSVTYAIFFLCRIAHQFVYISEDSTNCKLIGFISYFLKSSVVIWFNALFIDLFITLRRLISSRHKVDTKFSSIAIYAWGFPLLTMVTAMLADYLDWILSEDSIFKPNIAHGRYSSCVFTDPGRITYFYWPLYSTFVMNLILIILTAVTFSFNRKRAEFLPPDSRFRSEKRYFFLYITLFGIFEFCWHLGWLTAVTLQFTFSSLRMYERSYVFLFINTVFSLQGLYVFLILLLNKKLLGQARESILLETSGPRSNDIKEEGKDVACSESTQM